MDRSDPQWITHHGPSAPKLPPGTLVYITFSSALSFVWGPYPFEYWSPDAQDPTDYWGQIVAYRVVSDE